MPRLSSSDVVVVVAVDFLVVVDVDVVVEDCTGAGWEASASLSGTLSWSSAGLLGLAGQPQMISTLPLARTYILPARPRGMVPCLAVKACVCMTGGVSGCGLGGWVLVDFVDFAVVVVDVDVDVGLVARGAMGVCCVGGCATLGVDSALSAAGSYSMGRMGGNWNR